jgi:hypothetical protein
MCLLEGAVMQLCSMVLTQSRNRCGYVVVVMICDKIGACDGVYVFTAKIVNEQISHLYVSLVVFQKVIAAVLESVAKNVKVAYGDSTEMIYVRHVQVLVSSDPKAVRSTKYTVDELMEDSRRLSLFIVLDRNKPTKSNLEEEAREVETQGTALSGCIALFGVYSVATMYMFWRFVEDGHRPYPHYFNRSDSKDEDVGTFVRMAATLGFGRTDAELQDQIDKELLMVTKPAKQRKSQWIEYVRDKKACLMSRIQAVSKMNIVPESVSHDVVMFI